MKIKEIELSEIKTNPLQPRQEFDREKLQELADSIKESNLLQPIVVRPKSKGYEIVAGERRFKSFQILKKQKIPCIVWDVKDDIGALEKSTIENLQRDNLTSVERENVLHKLWKSGKYKTKVALSKKLGLSEARTRELIEAKEFREKIGPTNVSSSTIIETRGLDEEDRKEILKDVAEGRVASRNIRNEVKIRKIMKKPSVETKKLPFRPEEFTTELLTRISKVTTYLDNFEVKQGMEQYFSEEDKSTMTAQLESLRERSKEVIEMLETVDYGR